MKTDTLKVVNFTSFHFISSFQLLSWANSAAVKYIADKRKSLK
jgi:hypothetical protein